LKNAGAKITQQLTFSIRIVIDDLLKLKTVC